MSSEVSEEEIREVMWSLPVNKAPGPDGVFCFWVLFLRILLLSLMVLLGGCEASCCSQIDYQFHCPGFLPLLFVIRIVVAMCFEPSKLSPVLGVLSLLLLRLAVGA
ncbi:hypothetical protein U1Q18_040375 [Sarracenia purpurea var. burkii]